MKFSSRTKTHYGWYVLAISTISLITGIGFTRFSYSTVLPNMQTALGINNSYAGLLATMGLIGYLASAMIGGTLIKRFGIRLVITVGLSLAGGGMLLMGLSFNYWMVAFSSLLAGIGSGGVFLSSLALCTIWFAKNKRGLASSIATNGGPIGMILSGFIVPVFILFYGPSAWRASWLLFGCLTILTAVLAYKIARNHPAEKGLLPVGETETAEPAANKGGRADWKQVYRMPTIWLLGIIYVMYGFTYMAYLTFFVKHLVADAGFSVTLSARLFALIGWISLTGVFWGALSDRIGRKKTLVCLFGIQALAAILFSCGTAPFFFVLSTILYGFSAFSFPAIMSAICGDLLGPELASTGLGFITLFFGIGQVLAPFIAGLMADAQGTFAYVFLLTSAVAFTGALVSGIFLKASR